MESQAGLQQRVRELEARLAEVTTERDDLTRDLENLCLSGGNTFSSSSVLSERIYSTGKAWGACEGRECGGATQLCRVAHALTPHLTNQPRPGMPVAEKELSRCKEQLRGVIGERDAARDELRSLREAKHQGDRALAEQAEKAQALDRELAFYQQQVLECGPGLVFASLPATCWAGAPRTAWGVSRG